MTAARERSHCSNAPSSFIPTTRGILQRKCACGGTPGPTGECEPCRRRRLSLQPKLAIGSPNDRYEQEADRVAQAVVQGKKLPSPSRLGASSVQRQEQPSPQQELEKKREQPTQFPVEQPPKKDEEKEKIETAATKTAGEVGKYLWDQFSNSEAGKRILAANERDWKPVLKFFEDFADTLGGKVALGAAGTAAIAGMAGGAWASREPAEESELAGSPGKPPARAPKDEKFLGLELEWDFVSPPTGLTLKTPWLDSPKIPLGSSPPEPSPIIPPPPVLFKMVPKVPRICTPSDPQGDQGEADTRSAFIYWWLQRNRELAEKKQQEIIDRAKQPPPANPPTNYISPLKPLFKAEEGATPIADPEAIASGLNSGGQPLDASTRRLMEARFGHDFGNVRIHRDAQAAESARSVNARAFTVGSDIVFDNGRYAPQSLEGRRLLAHELAHVVQQEGTEKQLQRETYYSSGYKQIYQTVDQEIAAASKKPSEWHPATKDMEATASGSGGGEPVATLDDFLKKLEAQGKGSVTRLNLIGHSNSSVFSFGGKITKDNVEFAPDAAIYSEALTNNADRIKKLRDRFGEGAKIVLYSCDAGTGQELLDAVGDAFGVCVEGFTSEIWWCITKDKEGNAVRGRVWAQNPHDPVIADHPPDCNTLSANIATLTTGGKSKQCSAAKSGSGGTVQRKIANGPGRRASAAGPEPAPAIVHDVLAENGHALETRSRAFMERRFGHDFSQVRVHTGAKATASAHAVNALAYAVGPHVVFANERLGSVCALDSEQDRSLLAHELSHVVQQQNAPSASSLQIAPAADGAEREAEEAAQGALQNSAGPRGPRIASLRRARLQRQVVDFRSGHQLGAVKNPGLDDNTKRELEIVLRWLLELWAIEIPVFNATIISWGKYGPDDQISGADLQPFIDAVKKSETASLANEVSNNLLGLNLPGGRGVGDGSQNEPADLAAVQDALKRHGFLRSDAMADTLVAIKKFKKSVVEGRFGLEPMRPNERIAERDKFAARTFFAKGDAIPDVTIAALQKPKNPPVKNTLTKALPIFIPQGAPQDKNKVHVFFTPFLAYAPGGAGGFLAQQGLRAESDASAWLLIGVPALNEADQPNFVTISTSEIQTCLAVAGRKRTEIDALRLSAHSRGHRGLENTIGKTPGAKPLIDLKLVEKVTVFDASYQDLGDALRAQRKGLTGLADSKKPDQFASGAVQLYDVTVANVSKLPGTALDSVAIRGLSYARLVEEGIARGEINLGTIGYRDPTVVAATKRILALLPARGKFTTKKPAASGMTNLQDFIAANKADLTTIQDPKKGLKEVIRAADLDWGAKFTPEIDAHHWFVAELAHEAVE